MNRRFGSQLLMVLFLSGCTFAAPQFNATHRLIEDVILGGNNLPKKNPVIWLASVGNRGAVLRPYSGGGLTVFANADGDAISFDGWTIRSITGFSLSSPISIRGKEGMRVFTFGPTQTIHNCNNWLRSGLIWSQACTNGDGQISLDDAGNIQSITMALGAELGVVTLRVAK